MNKTPILFATTADHVGVLRSVNGNLPHIHQRMVSHKRALAKMLSMGMTKSHRANPLASLRAECIFAAPVLYSGITPFFTCERNILKIIETPSKNTFPCGVLSRWKTARRGSAASEAADALWHDMTPEGQYFKQNCCESSNSGETINKNWFSEIRALSFTYILPHPLLLLRYPPSKEDFKYRVKTNITDFWQTKLRQHSKELEDKCLKYLKPNFMSLSKPHPLYAIIRARIHQLPSK